MTGDTPQIRSLARIPFGTMADAFGVAFAEYEVRITPDELRTMLRRRGFDAALSFAAFDGDRIAAFTFNGVGTFDGAPTAYDTGTGTLPEYRGQGLATRIFEASLPHLRAAGIGQYLLEVLQHNTAAVSIYRNLGFEVTREFNYFRGLCGESTTPSALASSPGRSCASGTLPPSELREAPKLSHFDRKCCVLLPTTIADVREAAPEFWDFEPSWQNSFEAVERAPEDFTTLAAYNARRPVGYLIFEPAAGDITQIAVARSHRRRGIASALLDGMLKQNRASGVKCVNTEIGRDEALAGFLQAKNITLSGRQFEMIKKL